ncbi:ADIPOR-like receptor IZH2 [Colletotrichum sidae]|uniref:ADIPOR-like receptor IZH2 n=1 Tax=Colletotrichum sidae TaxID=1347389 RepID=A0A4R8TTL9_9PEZI|nr:ADIPOR-like receptor IZH2 [Colletotrichum sidae]
MAAILSTSTVRQRLRAAVGGGGAARLFRSLGDQKGRDNEEKNRLLDWPELPEWQKCGSEHIKTGEATNSSWECLCSWTFVHNETTNIYSHVFGVVLFMLLPWFMFRDGVPSRWTIASAADVVVCSIYAAGVTVCLILSVAFHTFMSHSEAYYLAGIKADFYGVLALMWSSTAPLAHYTFPCSPRTRDAYVLLTGLLAILCAVATARPTFGAVHLGHHRALLFGAFGTVAFVLPISHGVLMSGLAEESSKIGGEWVAVTAVCNAVAVLVYSAKFPELLWPKKFDIFGASHQLMHIMVLGAAVAYAKAVAAAFDYRHIQEDTCTDAS